MDSQALNRSAKSAAFCAACGAEAKRRLARYCRVCGKNMSEGYMPLDSLKSSYRMQGKAIVFAKAAPEKYSNKLFEENTNAASQMAWAFFVYSLVPYIGILFCPGAFVMGGVGYYFAYRKPYLGGGRVSAQSFLLSIAVVCFQIFLWWLLYIIPDLGRHF